MKKERILILIIGLLFAMPMQSQKLNSRGEKMVKEIMYYSKEDTCRISYTYDENDEVKSLTAVSLRTGHETTLTKTKNGIDIEVDSLRKNNPATKTKKTYATLNEDGNISRIEERDYCYNDGDYVCSRWDYEYTTDKYFGRKVVNKEITSSGVGSGKMNIGTRRMYVIEDGNTHERQCDKDWAFSDSGSKGVFSIEPYDLNINYPYTLLWGRFATDPTNLLYMTPWIPMAFKNIKIGEANKQGKMLREYKFTRVDGNIVRIELHRLSFEANTPYRIPYAMNITYVY